MKTLLAIAAAAFALPVCAQRISIDPVLPTYGQNIEIGVRDAAYPMYLPATRYMKSGSTIVIDYEYGNTSAGPGFGTPSTSLGELPPGNYTVQARFFDAARPWAQPTTTVSSSLPVVPPSEWGIYPVPREPHASSSTHATIRSAAYFDASTMKATVSGNVVRVEFTYNDTAPATGTTPSGLTTYASVELPPLAAGSYQFEGWGKPTSGGAYERFFTKSVQVSAAVAVVEYYSASLDHYFMTANTDEMAIIDRGGQGDWKRTGQVFHAWTNAADAPPGAVPVCRFYARGPNSHFYTGTPQECSDLKTLEQKDRADAKSRGQSFLGWGFEMVAFYALLPQGGLCFPGLKPVWRAYNNRATQRDTNHRFTTDEEQRAAMGASWLDEGAHLCVAG
jgi:hypothetical protein